MNAIVQNPTFSLKATSPSPRQVPGVLRRRLPRAYSAYEWNPRTWQVAAVVRRVGAIVAVLGLARSSLAGLLTEISQLVPAC
jgi:hypothetical protein